MFRILLACCFAVAMASPSAGQDRTQPRRIDPDRFPDYGIPSQRQTAPSAAEKLDLIPPSDARPLGACHRELPTAQWLRCLRDTATLTDVELDRTVAQIKAGFERREETGDVLRRAWSRALDESLVRWRSLRDYECQQLAMAEPEAPRELFEARMICAIHRNRARAAKLAARYAIAD